MATPFQSFARSSVTHVAFAFLAMGGWAVFANHTHGLERAAIAGLAQGAVSGLLTLGLKRFPGSSRGAVALDLCGRHPAASTITCAVVLAILLIVHRLAGTPNVLATISVPYAVSSELCVDLFSAVGAWAAGERECKLLTTL